MQNMSYKGNIFLRKFTPRKNIGPWKSWKGSQLNFMLSILPWVQEKSVWFIWYEKWMVTKILYFHSKMFWSWSDEIDQLLNFYVSLLSNGPFRQESASEGKFCLHIPPHTALPTPRRIKVMQKLMTAKTVWKKKFFFLFSMFSYL